MDTTYQPRHRATTTTTTTVEDRILAHSQGRAATTRDQAVAASRYTSPRVAAARAAATKADMVGELVKGLHGLQRSGRQ